MQKKEFIGLTKADKMLITQVIEHFIGIEKELKSTITEKGYKKLLEIHWSLGIDLIPELCLLDKKSFDNYAKASYKKFTENNNPKTKTK